jgi:hypothetical protein
MPSLTRVPSATSPRSSGAKLGVSTTSISAEHFGFLGGLVALDNHIQHRHPTAAGAGH